MEKWYPYRFKTLHEFTEEFGHNWYEHIHDGWNEHMDEYFGKQFMYTPNESDLEDKLFYNNKCHITDYQSSCGTRWSISWDMLTENEPLIPNYKPKQKIIRQL